MMLLAVFTISAITAKASSSSSWPISEGELFPSSVNFTYPVFPQGMFPVLSWPVSSWPVCPAN